MEHRKHERTRWFYIYPDRASTGRYQAYYTTDPELSYSGYSRLHDVARRWPSVEAALQLPCPGSVDVGEARIERIA